MERLPRHSRYWRGTEGRVEQRACNKAPGRDRICLDFFKAAWGNINCDMQTIFNQMFLDGRIMEQQKHGIVVRIHKTDFPTTPTDYEPINWLDTDYKIPARIRANILRLTIFDLLLPNLYSEVPCITIFDAVTTGPYSVCRVDTRPTMHYFLELHRNVWQDFSYLSTSNDKMLWLLHEVQHIYTNDLVQDFLLG